MVLQGRTSNASHESNELQLEISDELGFPTNMPPMSVDSESDIVHATRDDHHEGFWENVST